MSSTSFLNQLQDLDFTNDEQGAIFTPTIQWDSMNDDSYFLIIGKLISSNMIDDNAVVRAFQGIWKHDKIVSITTVKSRYYRIEFPTEDIRNVILSRGPWTFKGDWLALAALNPTYSIDEYTFLSMNVWIRIYGIPSILMDDDDIANHTGNSLSTMIGKVVKVDTRRIDLNMVDYLRIGIVLDVTKLVRRCVAIGGSGPSPKLCPLQYERLPTLCHGCGIIGHALDACATFKPAPNSNLQYGDWLRYIPPKKQELNTHSKVANIESTNVPINPVPATVPMDAIMGTPILAATDPLGTISAMEPKLAAATAPIEPNVPVANTTQVAGMIPIKVVAIDSTNAPTTPVVVYINVPVVAVFDSQSIEPFGSTMVPTKNSFGGPEGFIDFLANPTETTTEVPYLLDNMGLDAATTTILPIPREGRLEYDMGKSFLATSSMLFMFDDWLSKKSSPHTATIDEETPLVIARGAKRRSSMQNDNKLKKPSPPYCFKD
ncbi:hypothetical protein V6N12_019224 [Hibiscus sabdariffa]|uniref:DUF4283 domain-containing protein n=1 Tax=Hibiscus sabdariffa TaxID=183260 RepID=A0ABR2C7B7_9ROSI